MQLMQQVGQLKNADLNKINLAYTWKMGRKFTFLIKVKKIEK